MEQTTIDSWSHNDMIFYGNHNHGFIKKQLDQKDSELCLD